jgi:signal transduction histidine kinase/CheY-like chemotaxis protein
MFSDLKILFLHSSQTPAPEIEELFRNYFPLPSVIEVVDCDNDKTASSLDYDLVICALTARKHTIEKLPEQLAERYSAASFVFLSSDGSVSGLPSGLRVTLYRVTSDNLMTSLPEILPDLASKVELSIRHDKMALEKQLSDHILNSSRSMLSVINRDYVYERVNEKFCSNQGKSCGHFTGKSLREVWGEDNFSTNIRPRLDECFGGKTVQYQACFDTPAGAKRSFDIIFRPFYSARGAVTHLLAETFDITDKKEAETAFLKIQEELTKLEENIPVGYIRCMLNGDIVHINKACMEILGLDDKAAVSTLNLRDFYSDPTLFGVHVEHLLSAVTRKLGRVHLRSARNEERVCSITGFINTSVLGEPRHIDFAIEDMTREIFLESRLMQAQRLETVGALAGGIAHDFNNILTTIYGYAEMSVDDLDKDSPVGENMAKIIMAVRKAQSLTKQILTFSRQIEQEKVFVNLWQVLSETIGLIRSGMPHNIYIEDFTSDSGIQVLADPTQLFRVFLNLLTNSMQAMENRGGTLTINSKVTPGELLKSSLSLNILTDTYIVVSISDTGHGMDESLLNRIFEPFFTTREVGKGTGLGLSVVHGIVSELGGEITVSSKVGEGTRFDVYLPAVKEAITITDELQNSRKLLYISGNKFESKVLSLALQNAGYNIMYATTTKEILKMISRRESRPDLILFPDDLDNFSFFDLVSVMRKSEVPVPVILITDSQDLILKENSLISEFVRHFLIKPVSLREVRAAIEIAISNNS